MPTERVQRRIERLLDGAEQAMDQRDWALARDRADQVLRLDPENEDARAFIAAAGREPAEATGLREQGTGVGRGSPLPGGEGEGEGAPERRSLPNAPGPLPNPPPRGEGTALPASFANGRYLVKRFLGEGGKKRVYLAHDTTLDRDVAFALIKTDGLDDTARERISREAQAMGKLGTHPHIVTVFDLGDEGGQPYMVTELMGGGDVEGAIEQAPEHKLPLPTALTIAEQVCQGLEFAHGKGIVHRDLKPGNVWLTADGVAKIGDFGLAVAIDRTRLTQAGMMVGTVSYMPPEQATGGEVTPRSDLYSLGAMLYELVAGRPPFVGDEAVAIIGQHLNTPPVAPTWHRPDCPPGLEALILRLLEKDPSKRPSSAGEVREALEHIAAAAQHPSLPASLPQGERGDGSLPSPLEGEGLGMRGDNPLYRRVFVGREREVRQLQAAFDAALSGKGALAMVVGEPGIGKTAVCEQLATYVTLRGGTTLTGHCYEEGSLSLPYLAFVEALRSYAISRPPEALRAELGTAASDLARIVSEVRERLAVEPRPPGDPEEDRWRLLQAVSGFLRNASAVQPLLLVLEDLHWADQGTLDLLQHLARNLSGARLLVIGTYRDVEVDRSHPLSATLAELRRGAEFGRVLLRGLGTPEVQRMLLAITGAEVPGSLAESIHRQTEGNPLFVQEVVRYLVEEGHLGHGSFPSPHRGGAGGEVTAAAMSIPEGLRDVIGRRLSRLSPDCNRVLAVAAVIGRDFGLETLHAVVELDEEQVVSSLEEALHIGVLEEQSRPGSIRYRFAHAFFRQTLYEELIAPRRLRLHQQVAAALEQQYASRLEEHAAELAEHFAQSTDRGDLAKAVRYGELAAQRALAVYAYGEAARHLEQALAVQEVLDPDDSAKRCDLLLALGDALVSLGNITRAVEIVAPEALRLADGLADRGRGSRVCRIVLHALGAGPHAFELLDGHRWAEVADRCAEDGTVHRVYADLLLARSALIRGDSGRGERLQLKAADLAQQLEDPVAMVHSAIGPLNAAATPPETHAARIGLAEAVAKRPLERVRSDSLADVLSALGQAFLTWGRRDEAVASWQRANEAALGSQEAIAAFTPYVTEALQLTLDGKLEQALGLDERIRARAVEVDQERTGGALAARSVRRAQIYLGRAADALARIAASPDLFSINGVYSGQRALCLAHVGEAEEARDILHRMLAARDMGSHNDPTPASVLRYLLEAAVVLGETEAAAVLEARMAPLAGLLHTEADMCYNIGRLCGGAAALRGDAGTARGYFLQALEICEKVCFRPEIALTRLELAELLLEHYPDERAAALEHLEFAIGEFREMKMQPSLERALRHKDVLKA